VGFRKIFGLLAAILLLSQPSFALEKQQILNYIQFITEWSNYQYNQQPLPEIRTESDDMLLIYAYGDYAVAQAEYNGKKLRPVMAIYDHKKNELLVSQSLDLNNSTQSGPTLVHELVHYLQDINGKTALYADDKLACLEGEAYDIQALWQVVNNVRADEYQLIQQDILLSFMNCEAQFKAKR
jgi:hypothetical protein